MEIEKNKFETEKRDSVIVYSQGIKAGKRIYYLDVRKGRNDDLFLTITESKKKVSGLNEDAQVSFEKHKIFLYREDFEKFMEGMNDVVNFIKKEKGEPLDTRTSNETTTEVSETEESKPKSFFDKFKF
jgi:viroplasmin and RNaseH domain-containing protein